jgi:hypothetical protein
MIVEARAFIVVQVRNMIVRREGPARPNRPTIQSSSIPFHGRFPVALVTQNGAKGPYNVRAPVGEQQGQLAQPVLPGLVAALVAVVM